MSTRLCSDNDQRLPVVTSYAINEKLMRFMKIHTINKTFLGAENRDVYCKTHIENDVVGCREGYLSNCMNDKGRIDPVKCIYCMLIVYFTCFLVDLKSRRIGQTLQCKNNYCGVTWTTVGRHGTLC